MKSRWLGALLLALMLTPALAVNISSAGVDGPDGGLLKIDQTDEYWWFCAQPDVSEGPLAPGPQAAGPLGFTAEIVPLEYGWSRQTTERFNFTCTATPVSQADLVQQVHVIEYLLDAYLPWSETTDNFLNNKADPVANTDQEDNLNFFNRFYAIQHYVEKLHSKIYEDQSAFTPLSVYSPDSDISNTTPAEVARNNFFNAIKADINTKAGTGFFDSYDPVHEYAIINTFAGAGTPSDYQDGIILGGTVPEPSSALLALAGLACFAGRRRS